MLASGVADSNSLLLIFCILDSVPLGFDDPVLLVSVGVCKSESLIFLPAEQWLHLFNALLHTEREVYFQRDSTGDESMTL